MFICTDRYVSRIPKEDPLGVTVVLLTCSYKRNESVRVGYYVNNEYSDPEVNEKPPTTQYYTVLHSMARYAGVHVAVHLHIT